MRPLPLAPRWSRLQRPVVWSDVAPSRRIRAFHSTRPAPFVAELVTASTGLLHGVHSVTGLPWVASIPLTAFVVRMVVAFPLLCWSRINARKQGDIAPLLYCHRKHIESLIKDQSEKEKIYMRPQQAEQKLRKHLQDKTDALYREWGVKKYAQYIPVLQLPVWLSLMEGIRNMSGVTPGLFGYLLPIPDKDGYAALLPGPEQTFASEGILNLLAADHTGILPALLAFSIIANIRLGWKTKTLAEASDYADRLMARFLFTKFLKEFLTGFGVYIGCTAFITGMPAGMMLYWIASTNTATLQTWFLNKYLFASKPLKTLTPMHVRTLKPGEKPPPVKPLLP